MTLSAAGAPEKYSLENFSGVLRRAAIM